MAKKEKRSLYLNQSVINEFRTKFHAHLSMNFFSNKKVLVSKSCHTTRLPYMLGELNGIFVNEWPEEKSVFDVLIISEIDYEEIGQGNFYNDVRDAVFNINKRQAIVDQNKLSADIYIIREKDFIEYWKDRSTYIEENKVDSYNPDQLFQSFIQMPPGIFKL